MDILKIKYIWIIALLGALALNVSAQPKQYFTINYLTAETVYLKGGKADGLGEGAQLAVYRDGKRIGLIEVAFLATHSASCKILEQTSEFLTGDRVILLNPVEPVNSDTTITKRDTTIQRKRVFRQRLKTSSADKPTARVHGSAGIQLYYFNDQMSPDFDFFQPTFRIKLRADQLFDGNYQIRLKTRTRQNRRNRSYSNRVPESKWRNRIYEFSLIYDNPNHFFNFRVGRIISNYFSGIGYIDGLLLQQNYSATLTGGIFAGTQPEWQYSDFQTSLQKYGAFLSWKPAPEAQSTLAFAGEYHGSTVSREFFYWQNRWQYLQKFYFFQSSEIDLNRSWKRDYHSSGIQLTSLYLNGRWQVSSALNLGLAFDNRRNYLSYEWKDTPDSLFYEALRTGWRASVQIILPGNYRLNADLGYRHQQAGKNITRSFSIGLFKSRFLFNSLSVYGRIAGFNNPFTRGNSFYGRLNYRLGRNLTIETSVSNLGYEYKSNQTSRNSVWYQAGLRGYLGKRFYFYQSLQKNSGDDIKGIKTISELGIRF
ncbi:MAG: hypothetical protein Kow0037_07930 [Calditrichia bacterium]